MVMSKYEAVWAMIIPVVIWASPPSGIRSFSTISASARSTCCRFRLANAVTRISAPLELANIGLDPAGDEFQHLRSGDQPFLGGLLSQDRNPRLEVGRLYVGDQPPAESAAEARFEILQQFRRPIGGHHDLLLRIVQGVERVEELFLVCSLPSRNWMSSISSTSTSRYRRRKSAPRFWLIALMKSLVSSSVDT
jgi:hypothetical protein